MKKKKDKNHIKYWSVKYKCDWSKKWTKKLTSENIGIRNSLKNALKKLKT